MAIFLGTTILDVTAIPIAQVPPPPPPPRPPPAPPAPPLVAHPGFLDNPNDALQPEEPIGLGNLAAGGAALFTILGPGKFLRVAKVVAGLVVGETVAEAALGFVVPEIVPPIGSFLDRYVKKPITNTPPKPLPPGLVTFEPIAEGLGAVGELLGLDTPQAWELRNRLSADAERSDAQRAAAARLAERIGSVEDIWPAGLQRIAALKNLRQQIVAGGFGAETRFALYFLDDEITRQYLAARAAVVRERGDIMQALLNAARDPVSGIQTFPMDKADP